MKKKESEKAVEKEATDLRKKNQELGSKIEQLQRENDWLRSLVTVKDDRKVKEDATDDRKPEKEKKGVGTERAAKEEVKA